MKILLISPNFPFPPDKGDRLRTNALVHLLTERKIQFDLICLELRNQAFSNPLTSGTQEILLIKRTRQLVQMLVNLFRNRSLSSAYYSHPELTYAVRWQLQNVKYDAVFVVSSAFDYLIPIIKEQQISCYWDLIDFDSLKWQDLAKSNRGWKKLIYQREAKLIKKAEDDILDFARDVLIISQREIQRREVTAAQKIQLKVLPPIIPLPENQEPKARLRQIIFTGQMDYQPNIFAVEFFAQQVMPKLREQDPDLSFIVVGRNPSASLIAHCPLAHFTGEVDSVVDYLKSSSIGVAPLSHVFGTPNKVLEAFAANVPMVVTSNVAQALVLTSEVQVLIADTVEDYQKAISRLLTDQNLSERLVASAYKYLIENYSLSAGSKVFANIGL